MTILPSPPITLREQIARWREMARSLANFYVTRGEDPTTALRRADIYDQCALEAEACLRERR